MQGNIGIIIVKKMQQHLPLTLFVLSLFLASSASSADLHFLLADDHAILALELAMHRRVSQIRHAPARDAM